jgi:hypothetical protein
MDSTLACKATKTQSILTAITEEDFDLAKLSLA